MSSMRICLISFSNNADHQNVVYSMFDVLKEDYSVFTIGIKEPKSMVAPHTERNLYINCPERPGISKEAFRFSEIKRIADWIKQKRIDILYFESQHLWNAFLMALCPKCKKVVAVHDVIPHDGNKAMDLSNFVTCHQADHIVLRNKMYKETLAKRYRLPIKKISCIDLWRYYPAENQPSSSREFLCFGRIRRYKGFDLLQKIMSKTPEIQYRIVGAPDEESIHLVEEIKKLPNAVVIDREVTDAEMQKYFHQAAWLVLPYSEATQSGVITDACCMSRPAIAFDVGAISEQIDNGKTGFLIPRGDIDAFADKVREVSGYSEEAHAAFCHHAYAFGYEKYSAESAAPRFLQMLDHVKG